MNVVVTRASSGIGETLVTRAIVKAIEEDERDLRITLSKDLKTLDPKLIPFS